MTIGSRHDIPPFEAYQGSLPYVFVSYSHDDAPDVYSDLRLLYNLGCRIWYDEGIIPGSEWPDIIASVLARCSLFVVFISSNSVSSRVVRNEINYALDLGKDCIAIYIMETDLSPGLRLRLGDVQAIMKYRMSQARYERMLERVVDASSIAKSEQELLDELVNRIAEQLVKFVESGDDECILGQVFLRHSQDGKELLARIRGDFHPFEARELVHRGWNIPPHALEEDATRAWTSTSDLDSLRQTRRSLKFWHKTENGVEFGHGYLS